MGKRDSGAKALRRDRKRRADEAEGEMVIRSLGRGCALRVATGCTPHWLFDRAADRLRVLEWWPATGRWFSPLTRENGYTHDFDELLDLASYRAANARLWR